MTLWDGEKITDLLGCLVVEIIGAKEDNLGHLKASLLGITMETKTKDGIDYKPSARIKTIV